MAAFAAAALLLGAALAQIGEVPARQACLLEQWVCATKGAATSSPQVDAVPA